MCKKRECNQCDLPSCRHTVKRNITNYGSLLEIVRRIKKITIPSGIKHIGIALKS